MRFLAFVFLAIFLPSATIADDVLTCRDDRTGVIFALTDEQPRVLYSVNEDLKAVVMQRAEIGFLSFQGQWPGGQGVAIGADLEFYIENEALGHMEQVGSCQPSQAVADGTVPANEPDLGPEGGGLPGSYLASDGPPPELLAAEARRATRSLPMFVSNNTALDCAARSTNNQDAINCIGRSMLSGRQRAAVECIASSDGGDFEALVCAAEQVDGKVGQSLRLYERCVGQEIDADCLAQNTLRGRELDAYHCLVTYGDMDYCAGAANVDMDSRVMRAATYCQSKARSQLRMATCLLEHESDNPKIARAAGCAGETLDQGNWDTTAVARCYFADQLPQLDTGLTPEQEIVLQCAIKSGGQPYAFAGCAGGELTVRELSKCLTQGIGNDGCFGPNNEVVKSLRALGVDTDSLLNPNGEVIKAWNSASRDLVAPGPNNDVVRTLGELEGMIDNVGAEAQRVGSTVENAVEDLGDKAGEFFDNNLNPGNLL